MTTRRRALSAPKAGEVKKLLTAQLGEILQKYEGKTLAQVGDKVKKDCEDFLLSKGIQRALFPQIDIYVEDGYAHIVIHSYPKPVKGN